MGRIPSGSVVTATLADGTRRFRLGFLADGRREEVVLHERPGCECGCGGGWSERSARIELENIVARVRAGLWHRREAGPAASAARMPSFHEYVSIWLERKVHGAIGDRPLAPSTAAQYRTALTGRLLPYFARFDLDQIDRRECLEFKAQMLREAAELRAAIAAGADLRDARNRRVVPLSAFSARKVIGVLAMVLDDAIEDELIERNPARGKRHAHPGAQARARVPRARRARRPARRRRRLKTPRLRSRARS